MPTRLLSTVEIIVCGKELYDSYPCLLALSRRNQWFADFVVVLRKSMKSYTQNALVIYVHLIQLAQRTQITGHAD